MPGRQEDLLVSVTIEAEKLLTQASGPPRNFKRELTTKQVRAAHNRVSDKRFPTVNMYLDEFTKELNIELQKEE